MKYKVQEMMIESSAKKEAIDKWTAEPDEKLERRIREGKLIEEVRQELQKSSRIRGEDNNKDPKCTLPKLVVSLFNGTHIDYVRFWNQFETRKDKSELSLVTKLSCLKEMVIPQVWLLIDGFTMEY